MSALYALLWKEGREILPNFRGTLMERGRDCSRPLFALSSKSLPNNESQRT